MRDRPFHPTLKEKFVFLLADCKLPNKGSCFLNESAKWSSRMHHGVVACSLQLKAAIILIGTSTVGQSESLLYFR
jgi:hypothetical protein